MKVLLSCLCLQILHNSWCHAFVSTAPCRRQRLGKQTFHADAAKTNVKHRADAPVDYDVVIIGGGLVGLATAVALLRHDDRSNRDGIINYNNNRIAVKVYEKSTRTSAIGAAIGLYPNGLTAIEDIAPTVHATVRSTSIPSRYFERRDLDDKLVKRTDVQAIGAVSPVYYPWYLLQQHLADEALKLSSSHDDDDSNDDGDLVARGHVMESFEVQPNGHVAVHLRDVLANNDDCPLVTKTCRVLIGADGIHSMVRRQLFPTETIQPRYYDKILYRAVLSWIGEQQSGIAIPPAGTQISYQCNVPGQSFSFRETTPGILTLTAAAVVSETDEKEKVGNHMNNRRRRRRRRRQGHAKARLQEHFVHYPAPVQQILARLPGTAVHEDWIRDTPVAEAWSNGPVVILGDARGAMTPHMGQGAAIGLEDVCVLRHYLLPVLLEIKSKKAVAARHNMDALSEHSSENDAIRIAEALEAFAEMRRPRVAAVHEQSRQNSIQSKTFDQKTAGTPFERRKYTKAFKDELYEWKPPVEK